MKLLLKTLVLSSVLGAMSACSSTPALPFKQNANFGSEVAQVSKAWKKGEADVEKGEKLVEQGNKLVRNGNDVVSKGRTNERTYSARLQIVERDYQAALELAGASEESILGGSNPKVLIALEKDVSSAKSAVDNARQKQKQGRDTISKGKSKIKKGKKLIRDGRAHMEDAEGNYRNIGS